MEIVPVLDVMAGQVVRGVGGRRHAYAPWHSPLGGAADPGRTLDALLRLWPFRAVYVADLDAIAGRPPADLAWLARPLLARWVDPGIGELGRAEAWLEANAGAHLVLGSESQRDVSCLRALRRHPRVVLSLDFRGATFLGPPELLDDPGLWPSRVVAMALERVGEALGPDFSRLAQVIGQAGGRRVYAAGGVRDVADVRALSLAAAAGALVASALHTGALGREALAEMSAGGPEG